MTPQCAELVMEKTLCIYLKASVDTLMKRLASETESRPLLDSNTSSSMQNRIEDLLAQRSATYENTASITIDTDGKSIEEIATSLAAGHF
jgi:shikimate kinase